MPRNGSGTYTLPTGNPVVPDTIIQADWANDTMNDIATQLNGVMTRDGLLGPTAPIKSQDGTVSLPGFSFAAQPSSGLFRTALGIGLSHAGIVQLEAGTNGVQLLGLQLNSAKTAGSIASLTVGSTVLPAASTVLDCATTTKAIRLPRLATATRLALPNTVGLFVYDSDLATLFYNDGIGWMEAGAGLVPTADQITSLPHGDVSATTVQGAINELADEKQALSEKGQPNGYAALGPDGLVVADQLPPLTTTETFVVESEAEMLALPAKVGDLCVRNDLGITYILQVLPPTDVNSWVELQTATSGVTTVNGRSGDVVLTKTDVSLGNVDNTSDIQKPISTATQNALNLKANVDSPTFTGVVGGITKGMVGLGNVDNTADTDKPVSTATQTALSNKQDTSQKNIANGYAGLDATGKVPTANLPSTSVSSTFVVSSEAEMLALPAIVGDMAVRNDISQTFVLQTANPTILANWVELLSPTSSVTSVNGMTGAVSITTITGNAGSATLAAVTNDTTTNATVFPTWVGSNSGNQATKASSTKLTFNPSTGLLSATKLAGDGTDITGISSSTVEVTNSALSATRYVTFAPGTSGAQALQVNSTKLTFNPSTGLLSATGFAGAGTSLTGTASALNIGGNAATATTAGACTGNAATVTGGVYTSGDQSIAGNKTFTTRAAFGDANYYANLSGSNPALVTDATSGGSYLLFNRASKLFSFSTLGIERVAFSASGVVSAANVSAYSDERVKTNWRDFGLDFVQRLAVVKSGIYDRTDCAMTQVGVSAQSLRHLMPDAVLEDKDGKLSVAYGNAALAACVELAKEVVELRRRLQLLEG